MSDLQESDNGTRKPFIFPQLTLAISRLLSLLLLSLLTTFNNETVVFTWVLIIYKDAKYIGE